MKQLRIEEIPLKKTCAFTGHRVLEKDFSEKKLKNAIKSLLDNEVFTYYNGMAIGFDLLAAEILLSFKDKYPQIKLVACIPCADQNRFYSIKDKKRYAEILKQADEQVVLSETYTKYCMHKRNRYMCDRAGYLITYCNKPIGGTAYTVEYFQKNNPYGEVIKVN